MFSDGRGVHVLPFWEAEDEQGEGGMSEFNDDEQEVSMAQDGQGHQGPRELRENRYLFLYPSISSPFVI